jgi:hypothetical protein
MSDVFDDVITLARKWIEMVTGGLIAVYLVIQPFTGLPSAPRKLFFAALAAAWAVASFRVWRDQKRQALAWRNEIARMQIQIQEAANTEEPNIMVLVRWPKDDPPQRPVKLIARVRGKSKLSRVKFSDLRIGLHAVTFPEIPELLPDRDDEIGYIAPQDTSGAAVDILDLLMVNRPTEISPMSYPLVANLEKANGQMRRLSYTLTYAPLHNQRRVSGANETYRCITVEPS